MRLPRKQITRPSSRQGFRIHLWSNLASSLHHFVWEKVWDREKWKNHVQWSSIKFDVCLIHSTGPTSLRVEISTNVKRKCDRYVQMFHRSRKASLQWQWHVWAVCAVSKTSDVCRDFNSEMHPLFWHFSWVAQSFHHFWPGKAHDKTSVRLISKVWEGKPGKYHAKPPRICLDVPQTTPMPPAPSQSLEARNGPGTDSTGWAWSFVAQLLLFVCLWLFFFNHLNHFFKFFSSFFSDSGSIQNFMRCLA